MMSLTDLTRQYVKFYAALRKYIWPYDTVEKLAELEIAIYNRFPDKDEIKSKFESLYRDIQLECREDEELSLAAQSLRDEIYSTDAMYSLIDRVNEVYDYENNKV